MIIWVYDAQFVENYAKLGFRVNNHYIIDNDIIGIKSPQTPSTAGIRNLENCRMLQANSPTPQNEDLTNDLNNRNFVNYLDRLTFNENLTNHSDELKKLNKRLNEENATRNEKILYNLKETLRKENEDNFTNLAERLK